MARGSPSWTLAFALLLLVSLVAAHEHHDEPSGVPYEQNFTNDEEIDNILKWHMAIQSIVWCILFPLGMVLGITKSPYHVPLQSLASIITIFAGNYLGHHHKGRSFHTTAHSLFAGYLKWYLLTQIALGVYLKLHIMEGTRARRLAVGAHGVIGKTFPVVGWVQCVFGGIASLGFCFGEHFGQCLAHFIMGSAFIAYAMIMLLMMRVGAGFLLRHKVSQEYLDSWVIMVWGIVNTFTEHDFLQKSNHWSHKDMQHVSLGVLWWAGGALGIFLSRNGKRNVVPALIIGMTGFAMSAHGQSLEFSTTIHKLFGFCLMSAGLARIIEVCFVLKDQPSPPTNPSSFQHLPPFLLVLSGLTFLSATEEQMVWINDSGMDSTTYANILFSGSFAVYLVGNFILEVYERTQRVKEERDRLRNGGGMPDAEGGGVRLVSPTPADRNPRGWMGFIPGAMAVSGFVAAVTASASSSSGAPGSDSGERGRMMGREAGYEAVPLTARTSGSGSGGGGELERGGEPVFDLGDEEGEREGDEDHGTRLEDDLEDDGGDAFWSEKERKET